MLQDYDFTALTNGAAFPIGAAGRFIYYLKGSAGGADSTIYVRAGSSGTKTPLMPGQAMRLDAGDKTPDTWYIINKAGTAPILGTVLIGIGDFSDNRISGSVEVIDGGKNRTLSGVAFLGTVSEGVANAGCYLRHQLWNPAGSGKNLVVEKLLLSSGTTNYVEIAKSNAALGTASGRQPVCKKIGGPASVAQLFMDKANASPVLPAADSMIVAYLTTYTTPVQVAEPIILPPGFGLLLRAGQAATDMPTVFEFYEDGI